MSTGPWRDALTVTPGAPRATATLPDGATLACRLEAQPDHTQYVIEAPPASYDAVAIQVHGIDRAGETHPPIREWGEDEAGLYRRRGQLDIPYAELTSVTLRMRPIVEPAIPDIALAPK